MRMSDTPILPWLAFIVLHIELAWMRAIAWWIEIGCSIRALPALHAEAFGRTDWASVELVLVLAFGLVACRVVDRDRATA
jgi:hypothetical protein